MVNYKQLRKEYKEHRHILGLRPDNVEPSVLDNALVFMSCLMFALFLLIGGCNMCHADEIPQDRAVNAIIGEAESQGYIGLLAVACAIRNRGTINGVYGERSPRVVKKMYSKKTYQMAITAWEKSQFIDITRGATHWENIKAFGKPDWASKMVETLRYKDHVFYKEV